MYRKIHITPNEVFHWGITGGDTIQTFDTDCGKIGIVICYDVEFPELSRLMADEGMNILFVPFLPLHKTVTHVKHCAQAEPSKRVLCCYLCCVETYLICIVFMILLDVDKNLLKRS
jgi:predicted amidohydrolase